MSSTSVLRFIKDINAKNVAFVQQRLKGGEKAQQSYCDPARQNTTYSLLHRSVLVGSSEIVAALLRQGADCNGSDSSRRTPLHWLAAAACSSGGRSSGGMEPAECAKIAELLLRQKGIDVSAADSEGRTALHEAAAYGNVALAAALLAKGAAAADDRPGYTPLHAACQARSTGGSTASSSGTTQQGDCMAVADLLLQHAPQLLGQQSAASSFTPLMQLLQRGLWGAAAQLLSRGDCNVNACSAKGETALLLALGGPAAADVELVAALLAAGAAADVQQPVTGDTPLMLAIRQHSAAAPALLRALLPACSSSSLAATNAAGETAASLAAAAVLTTPPRGAGGTAACPAAAAESPAEQVLQQLLRQRLALPADVAAALLQRGLAGGLPDSVTALLVSQSPDAALADCSVDTLMASRMFASAAALMAKQSGRAVTDALDADGNTPLHAAVSGAADAPELVRALLALGVPPNAANRSAGDTALHVAARAGHVEACRVLLEGGADVLLPNAKNRLPGRQLKLAPAVAGLLSAAEELARVAKEERRHALWDAKMRSTQTQNACGVRVT